jgi:hypothetical protein
MSLRLDPRGLRSIDQVITDLSDAAAQLRPDDPRFAKLTEMIRGLQEIRTVPAAPLREAGFQHVSQPSSDESDRRPPKSCN